MNTAAANLSTYQRIKRRTFEIMEGEVPDKYSHFVEIFIALLVVANVVGIILESVPEIHEAFMTEFHAFDVFSVAVFSVEFVLRVWSYSEKYVHNGGTAWQGRKEYVFSFYGIIDFVSTVPFYLQLIFPGADLRVLRMFRLMRIFKLSRYNSAFEDMVAAVKAERDSFSSAVFLLFISCLLFSSLIYIIEGHEQPGQDECEHGTEPQAQHTAEEPDAEALEGRAHAAAVLELAEAAAADRHFATTAELHQAIASTAERHIREHLDQWLMLPDFRFDR